MSSWPDLSVKLPTRIHLGLLDMSLEGPRVDGGVGLMLDTPSIRLDGAKGTAWDHALATLAADVQTALGMTFPTDYGVCGSYAELRHVGLGSGTQLRMGLAALLLRLHERTIGMDVLAPLVGRGGTSGIGSWGFWTGGYVVDAGHARVGAQMFRPSSAVPVPTMPPLVLTGHFPWVPILGVARDISKIHGSREEELFTKNTPIPRGETIEGYQALYGEIVPALLEENFIGFCEGIDAYAGVGFKRREIACHGPVSSEILKVMRDAGLGGVTMSSWGPSWVGFAPTTEAGILAAEGLAEEELLSEVFVGQPSRTGATLSVNGSAPSPVREEVAADPVTPSMPSDYPSRVAHFLGGGSAGEA